MNRALVLAAVICAGVAISSCASIRQAMKPAGFDQQWAHASITDKQNAIRDCKAIDNGLVTYDCLAYSLTEDDFIRDAAKARVYSEEAYFETACDGDQKCVDRAADIYAAEQALVLPTWW